MSDTGKDRWRRINESLDRALDLEGAEAEAFVEALEAEDPAMATDLRALLAERDPIARDGFLEGDVLPRALTGAEVGQRLGPYTLLEPIASGGMGGVWLAQRSDGHYSGRVAIKLLRDGVSAEAFRREAGILARLTHPHIARLIDAGVEARSGHYLVLEYVDGERIDRYCDARALTLEARLALFDDILAAVAHAHANLIVHRDIKPSNVLVSREGAVKLLDFGIAKLLEDGAGAASGQSAPAMTPDYAAPEQIRGGPVTTATDVYALGVMLYVLLAGVHPSGEARDDIASLLESVVDVEPPPPSRAAGERRGRGLRGDLDAIVLKALRKKPEERYASVEAFAGDLRRHRRHEPVQARPGGFSYRAARFVRRHRLPAVLATALAVAFAGGVASTLREARATAVQRDLTMAQLKRAERVNEFTAFLLGQAQGSPIGVHEMLARAEGMIDKRFADDPVLAVEMRIALGVIYSNRSESDSARRVMWPAYQAAQRLADPALRARAQCAWAEIIEESDIAQAKRLTSLALAAIPSDALYDGVAAHCLATRASLAADEGDGARAQAAGEEALARIGGRPHEFADQRAYVLQLLAMARKLQGDTEGANRRFADALREFERMGREKTADAATLRNNWAITLSNTSFVDALAMMDGVIEAYDGAGPDSVPARLRLNRAIFLGWLGRAPEGRAELEKAQATARRQGSRLNLGLVAVQAARLCRQQGDLACARTAVREAGPALRDSVPAGHRVLADLEREEGLLAAAEGDLPTARRSLSKALAIHAKTAELRVIHVETLLDVARLELRLGQPAEAAPHARAALELSQRLRGGIPHSAWVGLSELALGEVEEASGRRAEARRFFRDAQMQLLDTAGPDHPATKAAQAALAARS